MSLSLSPATPTGPRTVPTLHLAAGLLLLAGAFVIEHVAGIAPCILCLYQRIPPAVVIVLAAAAAWPRVPRRPARLVFAGVAVVWAAGAGLAAYHVGVEQHWWAGTAQCGAPTPAGGGSAVPGGAAAGLPGLSPSLSDLRAALAEPELVRCDAVPWSLFGISLAGYNAIMSALLAILALWGVRHPAVWRAR